jgi:hypothetical protein
MGFSIIDNLWKTSSIDRREGLSKKITGEFTEEIVKYLLSDNSIVSIKQNNNTQIDALKHHSDPEIKELKKFFESNSILLPYIADIRSAENRREKNSFVIDQPNHKKHWTIKLVGQSDQGYSLALVLNENSKSLAIILAKAIKLFDKKFDNWKIKVQ